MNLYDFIHKPGEVDKMFKEGVRKARQERFDQGWCCIQAGSKDAVSYSFPPDGAVKIDQKDIKEAIEYAIRMNKAEGLDTSQSSEELLRQVVFGKITFEQVRKLIEEKARAMAQKERPL
jgi:uncharacterized protein (DUF433 family)